MFRYCREELMVHWAAAIRLRAKKNANMCGVFRAAQSDKNGYSAYIRDQEDVGRRIDRAMGIRPAHGELAQLFMAMKGVRFVPKKA